MTLLHFRDTLILPRHETLLSIFSRLSLDSINGLFSSTSAPFTNLADMPPPPIPASSNRPGTAGSLDPSSFNSQGSTLLDSSTAASGSSVGARSRATSNTSAGSFASAGSFGGGAAAAAAGATGGYGANTGSQGRFTSTPTNTAQHGGIRSVGVASASHVYAYPHPHNQAHLQAKAQADSAKITQTVARMLQCVSVLGGLRGLADGPTGNVTSPGVASSSNPSSATAGPARPNSSSTAARPSSSGVAASKVGGATSDTISVEGTWSSTAAAASEESDPELQARRKMEQLSKELKLNWLGRGRTGRNRRGLVGTKVRTPGGGVGAGVGIAAGGGIGVGA